MLVAVVSFVLVVCTIAHSGVAIAAERYRLSNIENAFLEDLSHRAFLYFWEQADPTTGLVLDRVRADGSPHDETHRSVASIAATGFGLTALCIAEARGWVQPHKGRERARATLRFFCERAPRVHGWFYHWMDASTGDRKWNSEVSSIDTALLLGGVLTARQFFRDDKEIVQLATKIYEEVDFPWMLNGHPSLLSHGWKPENGFLGPIWDSYSEQTILYLLAVGSPTHPITPRSWWAWKRDWITYAGYSYMAGAAPLFIHQYSQAWVDYRGQREKQSPNINYFDNSIKATRAHRAFCIDLSKEFPGYSDNIWGITASDSAKGYVAWGGPPRDPNIDGTVVPSAAAGSLMFTPDICLAALLSMRAKSGELGGNLWGRYGFVDAFNPNTGWVDRDVIGINAGITLLSAENLRSGNVWRWFMRNAEIPQSMRSVGLVKERRARTSLRRRISCWTESPSPVSRRTSVSSRDFSGYAGGVDESTVLEHDRVFCCGCNAVHPVVASGKENGKAFPRVGLTQRFVGGRGLDHFCSRILPRYPCLDRCAYRDSLFSYYSVCRSHGGRAVEALSERGLAVGGPKG